MASFAVLRVRKLKEANVINKTDDHNRRICFVSHAAPRKNLSKRILGGERSLLELINDRVTLTSAKRRKDSVLGMEIVLSASPEYFRPKCPQEAGVYETNKMREWAAHSLRFAKNKWGENLICCDLHLDESTPHFHLVVTPISEKKRKRRGKNEFYMSHVLDANSMFGPEALSSLQTEYANSMKSLGINRGYKDSPAKHQSVKDFYKVVNEAKNIKSEIKLVAPPLFNRAEWAEEQQKLLNEKVAERDARIEFQRRKISHMSLSMKVLERFGGFKSVEGWFKRFGQLVKDLRIEKKKSSSLEVKLDQLEENYDCDVGIEVEKQVRQLKNAYRKKSNEVEVLRSYSQSHPSPKEP